jgi:aldehyde dehydrogenase (NAD+)
VHDGFDQMPIAGVWRRGRSSAQLADRDPYSGETVLTLSQADASDVDEAYREAERVQPAWAATRPQTRRDIFERAAVVIERRKEEIVDWLVHESGSTRKKAIVEWRFTHLGLLEAATIPFHADGRICPSSISGKENRVYRRPVGVVGIISPWNFPFHLANRSVAPALASGNAVVIKPSNDTPVTGGLLLAKILEEAGLPPGVLSVVVGDSREIGDPLVDHPAPRVISFTGSTAVGRRIAERAGRSVKRVCLELGGNTPLLVLDDADLEAAVDGAVAGSFFHQGQICMAINRVLVDARCHDDFVGRFVDRARALRVGDPADPETDVGPVINQTQLDGILQKVEASIASGARPLLRGEPERLVLPPIVLDGVTGDMRTAREEVFGPVASILTFDGDEQGVEMANDTEYGLSSAVFTRDEGRGLRVASRIRAGMTHVNDWSVNDEPNLPFGGEKASGIGRYGGEWAVDEFTSPHWVSVQRSRPRYPI